MTAFTTVQAFIDEAEKQHTGLSEIALRQTMEETGKTREQVYDQMLESYKVMKQAGLRGVDDIRSVSGLTGGMAHKAKNYADGGHTLSGAFTNEVIYTALAVSEVNACMGKIVAAPTAGSCGIIPACFITLQRHHDLPDEKIVMGLFNASAIGMIIARNATIAGAEGGCQAECGSAAAMAASGMVELMGGSCRMCGHAAAQALKCLMGLVCDPVAGLVEEPCIVRNASSAAVAVVSAEMSLAGIESIIPIDEVISAMGSVGKLMPACLRETAEGGIAVTDTAKAITLELIKR